jgi:dihydropteroate synthase
VQHFLTARLQAGRAAGVAAERLAIDPGYGFGKTAQHNLQLLGGQAALAQALGVPLLAGLSRKSLLGQITGRPVAERLAASVAAAVAAVARGACIVRVHDVAATVDALKVWQAAATGAVDSWTAVARR